MEKVPLNNVQLDHLATADAMLKPYFYGTVLWTITQPTDQERISDRVDTDWRFGPIVETRARWWTASPYLWNVTRQQNPCKTGQNVNGNM